MDVRNAKPAEIDAVWFQAESKINSIEQQIASYRERANDPKSSPVQRERAAQSGELYERDRAPELAKLKAEIAPLAAEWARRGGWARYQFCQSDGGHFHKPGCHTLWRARVVWVSNLSGLSDNEVIEAVGYKACSKSECFPLAPVHPAWAISEARDKAAKVADREAKYVKGLALREKKVANIEKRLAKARAALALPDEYGNAANAERHSARYDIEWNERDLVWAKREVERWLAKRR